MLQQLKTWIEKIRRNICGPSTQDFYLLFLQIHYFLSSGFNLVQTMSMVADTQKNTYLKNALKIIEKDIMAGSSAADAFKKHKLFPGLLLPALEAGEKSSEIALVFGKMAEQMQLHMDLYGKIFTAMLTPKISGCIMIFLLLIMAKFMFPMYEKMYVEAGLKVPFFLPLFAKTIECLFAYFPIFLLSAYFIFKCCKKWYCSNSLLIDKWRLSLPVYRPLHFSLINHQFASFLSLMLNSGLSVISATRQTALIVENALMSKALFEAAKSMESGAPIGLAFRRADKLSNTFDPAIINLLSAGEKSGNIVTMLSRGADLHKQILLNLIDKTTTKLTVIIIVPMGIFLVVIYLLSLYPMVGYFDKLVK